MDKELLPWGRSSTENKTQVAGEERQATEAEEAGVNSTGQ